MKRLYQAADRIEAQILKDYLSGAGVESTVLGEYLSGAAGELPVNIYPEVWVIKDDELVKAQDLLQDFMKNHILKQESDSWTCANCGEKVDAGFDICWNCAKPRIDTKR